MEKLAEDVTARLKEQAFCVVFEDDLERCWPREKLREEEREREIEVFANSRGWIAIILSVDSGIRAIFRQAQDDIDPSWKLDFKSKGGVFKSE